MAIQGIGSGAPNQTYQSKAAMEAQAAAKAVEAKKADAVEKAEDEFVKTEETGTVTYKPPKKLTSQQVDQINEQRTASFQRMLTDMLGKQAKNDKLANGRNKDLFTAPSDAKKAAAAIGPGGEYSVDAVATRILDMAKSLAGGDTSKITVLRDAVEKGFRAAGVEWGGKLPDISHDTYTEVMNRFDVWEGKKPEEA